MTAREETLARVEELIEPFNKKQLALAEDTRFATDLEWDSLTVMDFVAAVEDDELQPFFQRLDLEARPLRAP